MSRVLFPTREKRGEGQGGAGYKTGCQVNWKCWMLFFFFFQSTEHPVLLREYRLFHICRKMLDIFYQSVVENAIFLAVIFLGSNIKGSDSEKVNKQIKRPGPVLGMLQNSR